MLDSILITPENRFLSLSTQDFGLYGGQTPINLQVGRAADASSTADDGQSAARNAAAHAPAEAADLADTGQATLDTPSSEVDETPAFSPSLASAAPMTVPAPGTPSDFTDSIAPTALAVFTPAMVPGATGSSTPSNLFDSPQSSVSDLPAASSLLDGVTQFATVTAPALVTDAVQGITTTVAGIATSAVQETTSVLTDTIGTTVDLVDSLASTAAPLLDDAVTGPLTDVVDGLVEDDLAGLSGSDPLGGVATLVDLVSTGDVFDIGETPVSDIIGTAAPDLLTTLADEVVENPLLGDHDDDDVGLLQGLTDPDPIGLF